MGYRITLLDSGVISNTDYKHLLTLQAVISTHQTDEMKDKNLQLVIPEAIHKTYTTAQQRWLWNIKSLLVMLLEKQGSR